LFLFSLIIDTNAISSKIKPNMPRPVPIAALAAYKTNAMITHMTATKCKFIFLFVTLTPSSPDRKVSCLLWHYSEAPQKVRNFLGLRATFC